MGEVALEAEVLYPMDFLPDPPRFLSHRCSHGLECKPVRQSSLCVGRYESNYDPFRP